MTSDPALAARARDWLFDRHLPIWRTHGWDAKHGGFHERLSQDLRPVELGYKRLLVQCRQLYCYSHACILGHRGDNERVARDGIAAHLHVAVTTFPVGHAVPRSPHAYCTPPRCRAYCTALSAAPESCGRGDAITASASTSQSAIFLGIGLIAGLWLAGNVTGSITDGLDDALDRKSTRLNSSHVKRSRMPSSA